MLALLVPGLGMGASGVEEAVPSTVTTAIGSTRIATTAEGQTRIAATAIGKTRIATTAEGQT